MDIHDQIARMLENHIWHLNMQAWIAGITGLALCAVLILRMRKG